MGGDGRRSRPHRTFASFGGSRAFTRRLARGVSALGLALLLGRWASQSAGEERWQDWLRGYGPPLVLVESLLASQGYAAVRDPALEHRGLRLFPGPLPEIAPTTTPGARAAQFWSSFDPSAPEAAPTWILVLESNTHPENPSGHLWILRGVLQKTTPTPREWSPRGSSWEGLAQLSQKWTQPSAPPRPSSASPMHPPSIDPREIRY